MHGKLVTCNLKPATPPKGNGPARTFRIPGVPGTVGFISPLGEHFCESCNRLRLTADGALRPCLLMDTEISVRESVGNDELTRKISQAIALKPERHGLTRQNHLEVQCMAQIGG
ncbi:MAG: GTP 3',8-cyclase [Chloroflexi bacterium]|nr:GTP 3',8-cyclase [Chloroflexota bacterium]